jgi:hypothetical protein
MNSITSTVKGTKTGPQAGAATTPKFPDSETLRDSPGLAPRESGKPIAAQNPLKLACPLCRRVATVEYVSAVKQGELYSCNYSGCRGLQWTHYPPVLL